MASGSIIKDFDVIEDISSGNIACIVETFLDALFLQATKERFGNGIDPAVTASTHAGFELVLSVET